MFQIKKPVFLLLIWSWAVLAETHQQPKSRPQATDPLKNYQACVKNIESLVKKLKCKIPPVRYAPGFSFQKSFEYWIQFYSARHGIKYDTLNAVVNFTQTEEGKKKLVTYFSGLRCAGLPGDPLSRKKWTQYLPPCPEEPPASPPWYKDSKWATATYHVGARACFRLGAPRPKECPPNLTAWECIGGDWIKQIPTELAEILKKNIPSQQCCFDSDGKLITEGSGAGTPDQVFKTRRVEEVYEKHFLNNEVFSRTMKDEEAERELKKSFEPSDDSEASIHHYIMDARIITACFPEWPGKKNENVLLYQSLGWAPAP